MRHVILMFILISYSMVALPQKPSIDSFAIKKWPSLKYNPIITDDGKYFLYTINNQPVGSNTLVIQSTSNSWKKEIKGVTEGLFSQDCKQVVFSSGDTLCFLKLGTSNLDYVIGVNSYKLPRTGRREWIAYKLNNFNNELILRNLLNRNEQHFISVTDYYFNDNGNGLLMKTELKEDGKFISTLRWLSISEKQIATIWSTEGMESTKPTIDNYSFDALGSQVAFIVQENKKDQQSNSIWYYKIGMDKAVILANDQAPGIQSGLSIKNDLLLFSKNGSSVFFYLQKQIETHIPQPNAVMVDVWHYNDKTLQPDQLSKNSMVRNEKATFVSVINLNNKSVIRVEQEEDKVESNLDCVYGDYIIISDNNSLSNLLTNYINQVSYYLFSLKDGSRKFLKKEWAPIFLISPGDKYAIYFDNKLKEYFSYDIVTGTTHNISNSLPTRLDKEYADNLPNHSGPVGIAGWLEKDAALLIYDNFDIWQVDPMGKSAAVSITDGYGYSHKIKFSLLPEADENSSPVIFQKNATLLLTAFNTSNKLNGFYRHSLENKRHPELLVMDSAIFYQIPNAPTAEVGMRPVKAKNNNTWIVQRQTSTEAPNYYLTHDFKKYTALTNIQPQKDYNWLTSELINWKQFDGTISQGILYKPENFDPQKKYPIIFNYYEHLSYRLYEFLLPNFIKTDINIPLLVSQGYIVFKPDIHFSIANISGRINGENAYNSVVSAALFLSKMSWIDSTRMGINGHSFGGGITNYLITHSKLFAAAVESAGGSDVVSSYLSLNRQFLMEIGQGRIGATLWERPDLYLKASSILKADQVTTPLLIMHNMKDYAVPWEQGVEMFLSLKHLGKKVWMLQYDDELHSVRGKNAIDYTIRFTQFFDHYLKDQPAPKWMTQGIPASMKGIETGYGLDLNGTCGKTCQVCHKHNSISGVPSGNKLSEK